MEVSTAVKRKQTYKSVYVPFINMKKAKMQIALVFPKSFNKFSALGEDNSFFVTDLFMFSFLRTFFSCIQIYVRRWAEPKLNLCRTQNGIKYATRIFL